MTRRVSNSSLTVRLRPSSLRSTSGSRSATYGRLPRRSRYPTDTSPWMASRTDVRATWNCSHSWRSAGSRWPAWSSPERMESVMRSRISSATVRRSTGPNGVDTVMLVGRERSGLLD